METIFSMPARNNDPRVPNGTKKLVRWSDAGEI